MNSLKKTVMTVIVAASILTCATACDNGASSTDTESASSQITSSVTDSEQSSDNDSSASDSESSVASEDTSSEQEFQYVTDGKFKLPNDKLSFTLPENYELISTDIVYQFSGTQSSNKFNLTVNKESKDINEVTEQEMTSTYEITMQDFKLIEFNHTTVDEKSAIHMQLSGKLYGINNDTTLTQYMIQSGNDAYCLTFTQTDYSENFAEVIESVISSLVIA